MFTIRHLAETGSTNDDAAALLGEPGSAGLVLVSDFQRNGRGRHARAWVAPAGSSLLFTAILPRAVRTSNLWALPFWAALGVADGIAEATGISVDLQWPNDILLDGRKCCGILCISRSAGDTARVGCGVGINVRRPAAKDAAFTLAAVDPPPAFLSDIAAAVERTRVLEAVLSAFDRRLSELEAPRTVAREWETRAALDGTKYRLLIDGEGAPFEAIARRLAPDGSLIVERDGLERAVALADARVVR